MGGDGDCVCAARVHGNATKGLHGVDVHERACGVRGLDDAGRGLHHARLVVRGHDAHERAMLA